MKFTKGFYNTGFLALPTHARGRASNKAQGGPMQTITVTERTGRKVRIPREAIWRLEGSAMFRPDAECAERTNIKFHRFPRLRRGFFQRYTAFLEAVRRLTIDLDKRLSCSLDVQESYQELREIIENQTRSN
ncbi:MAG TPA: hypothetical protein VMU43_07730 [Candidatus Acidoferrum sp.]|nr:hypothetical protein [Candidatus Acidoferrum sp.]